ncbi:hypothetical protein [Streptomyces hokutonensis]|uniref:hypothetical protein n=1 Tax=Streptomyces hokutonensis TaxID=1306990 RepID=UPI0038280A79
MTIPEIKKRLRELRADPGAEGATAEIQRLRGELVRARQKRDVTDMEASPQRPKKWAPRRPADSLAEDATDEDGKVMWGRDDVSGWPPELRARRTIYRP